MNRCFKFKTGMILDTLNSFRIVAKFNQSKAAYREIYSKTLTNEEVTIENIMNLASFFKPCTNEDMSIVFLAGHGVLNSDYDYFFGTYDMILTRPN